jgi:hypothetical protein
MSIDPAAAERRKAKGVSVPSPFFATTKNPFKRLDTENRRPGFGTGDRKTASGRGDWVLEAVLPILPHRADDLRAELAEAFRGSQRATVADRVKWVLARAQRYCPNGVAEKLFVRDPDLWKQKLS